MSETDHIGPLTVFIFLGHEISVTLSIGPMTVFWVQLLIQFENVSLLDTGSNLGYYN